MIVCMFILTSILHYDVIVYTDRIAMIVQYKSMAVHYGTGSWFITEAVVLLCDSAYQVCQDATALRAPIDAGWSCV
jgi:hypothetical protein